MMRWVVESSMKLRLMVVASAAVLGYFGVTQLRNMPLDVVPEFSRPYVEVQSEALGLSAAEVEAMLTVPLEADLLNGVPFVEEIRSESIPGLSSIVLFFEKGTDLITARQVTQERLLGIHALPNVSTPPRMMQPRSSTSRVMKIGLRSDTRSLIDLSVLARWTIVPRLSGVKGVANVSIWGQRRRQLQVQVDPAKLQAENVTMHQVIEATGNALWVSPLSYLESSYPGPGGWIETPNQRLTIQHMPSISTPDDLAQVAVAGTPLRLGQLANVVEDHQPLIGDALIEGAPSLMLVVEKFPWANTMDVTRAVEETVASLELGLSGVELDTSLFRPATYLELAAGNLATAGMIGAALACVALLALFLNWRTALVTAATLAMSLLAASAVLYFRGTAINMMLLAGLMAALAVLVDDAVVATHAVARRLRERGHTGTARDIVEAILGSRNPLMYATVIVLLVVSPVFFLDGVLGVFSQEIAVSYGIALLASLLVAATAAPSLSLLLLKNRVGNREAPILDALAGVFGGLTSVATRIPGLPVVSALAGVAVVVILLGLAGPGELPVFQERDVLVEFDAAAGTSKAALGRTLSRATKELHAIPGVRAVSGHMGRAIMSDRVDHIDAGELWVSVDRTADYRATVAAIRDAVHGYPGFDIDVNTYLAERMREDAGYEDGLVVRVYGENLDVVRGKAEEVEKLLGRIDGVSEPQVEYPIEHPNLEIEVDIAKAKALGLKPGDVRRAAATLLGGIGVGSLFEEQKVFDVVIWAKPEFRSSITNVEDILIDAPGGPVRLKDVASMHVAASPKVINREAVSQFVDVKADVNGNPAEIASEVQDRLRAEIEFPLEYRAEVLGGFTDHAASRARIRATAIAVALGVLLLLQAAFGSWRLATFLFLALPVSALGGVLVASMGGSLTSLGSLFGLVAILALATRNGMSLVQHYRDLEKQEGTPASAELVLRGTADRFVPIMTTAVVTALAVLPFAMAGNIAGHEVLNPMAVFILGGLVTATLVSLVVVPAAYLRHGGNADTLELS